MDNKSLNYNHLYYFHKIAQSGSLAGASENLSVTQPTLSQQLRHLEDHFGLDLFERKGRSLELNKNGKYVYSYTKQIFGLVNNMVIGLNYNQNIKVEKIYNIGLTPSISRVYAAELLKPLLAHQQIGVRITESPASSLFDQVSSTKLDFVISEKPNSKLVSKNLDIQIISSPKYHFVCGKNFENKNISIPDGLESLPYFKYSSTNPIQKEVDRFFHAHKIYPSIIGESDDINIIIAATSSDHCFSVVPHIAVEEAIRNKNLFSLGLFEHKYADICAISLKDISNKKIRDMIELLKRND